ncbi:HD family phosphohydrolase [Clostridium kluyveri]|uniref:HD family phosphohydrolase n=1 Tax=Clostridium kluyveri TaxID=1534 RepID=UPI0022450458|nr:HD family phosphohydrolase [Clostridium kluyveri]UZQ51991.1 HD family phosphohydrolase [Clostridium kluyveri]
MIELIKSVCKLKEYVEDYEGYRKCISDLIQHEDVISMKNFIQHGDITCLQHSTYVSYMSYLVCKDLGLDYSSAARGGLLHDFFLYDWHVKRYDKGLHGFTHPYTALENANRIFQLNEVEKDIIVKHMWPLTFKLPKYKESFIVMFVDKYCASMEIIKFHSKDNIYRLMSKILS